MIKTLTNVVAFFIVFGLAACSQKTPDSLNELPLSKEESFKEAMVHEFDRVHDPKLNEIPYDRLITARKYYKHRELQKGKTSTPFSSIKWQERGPNNVGGRTRAVLFLSATKVMAAGVTGGLWITDDITASSPTWVENQDFGASINISCFAQHPDSFGVIYAGTGESFARGPAGSGIYKSIDTGQTWSLLANTAVNSLATDFFYISRLLVSTDGDIYASTQGYYCNYGGLQKSTDNGVTWSRVLGSYPGGGCGNADGLAGGNIEENGDGDLFYTAEDNGKIYISNKTTHGANVGNSGNWVDITPPAEEWQRIEIAVSKQASSGVIYAACEDTTTNIFAADYNNVSGFFYSTDKGTTWTTRTVPTICDQGGNNPYTRSQAWYDQVVTIDPANDNTVFIGGIDLLKSTDAGATFDQVTTWSGFWPATYGCFCCSGAVPEVIHADQHALVYNPFTANAAISANDGGVYYSTDMNAAEPTWSSKNTGFNVTQYYGVATHPTDADYVIGGTQDNGSHKLTSSGLVSGTSVSGGDGAYSHIHQTNPTYQSTQYVYNSFYLSSNGGVSFPSQNGSNTGTGRFINPSDMDDANNRIFSAGNPNDLEVRTGVNTGTLTRAVHSLGFSNRQLTALKVSPNNTTHLYVGDNGGNVYKITSRNGTPVKSATWNVGAVGYISSIDVWNNSSNTDDSILVTLSSYGVNSVYVTGNGMAASPTWVDIDDNNTLQDMPIRWGLFSKEGPDKIFIASDLGVLATDNINGNSTMWTMINNNQLPFVRVDALDYDSDDNLVIATHGRGIWETREPCSLTNATLPTTAGTYTATKMVQEGNYNCYCDNDDNLLVAIDINGSGAVIPTSGVSVEVGATPTTSWNTSGGIITNPAGGAIMNRKWNVTPTAQPTGNVKVVYPFSNADYTAVVSALASLTSPTTITSPEQLTFYKMTNGGAFADPHASGATGILFNHTGTPGLSTWAYNAVGNDHSAEFLVNSFSGGGGGGGGGNAPLPVSLFSFEAKAQNNTSSLLTWKTSGELNNKGFHVERSWDSETFERIGFVNGQRSSNEVRTYRFIDNRIPLASRNAYYRLVQIDYSGEESTSSIRLVRFQGLLSLAVFPNPTSDVLNISTDSKIRGIELVDLKGNKMPILYDENKIDVSEFPAGTYFLTLVTEEGRTVKKFVVTR